MSRQIRSNLIIYSCVHFSVFHIRPRTQMKCTYTFNIYSKFISTRWIYLYRWYKTTKSFYRRLKWIRVSGVKDFLYLSPEALKERFFCSCHFAQNDITVNSRSRLPKPNAVPSIFNDSVVPLSEDDILEHQQTMPNIANVKIVTTRKFKFSSILLFIFPIKSL